MEEVIRRAELVAETKSTVLITGETGTGKELVARAIHDRSAQRDMPLIKVNCAAIPETLLESELFGHVRGAFTGATTTKKGKFALADGGTIFLDEIGTMSPPLQSKLLRVLQEREFEPLGSERTEKVDLRVIAATNRDLRQMVADGKFQEDLFYRLNVIPIEIPPLRERRDDIPALVEHFIRKHAQRVGRRIERLEDSVMTGLQQYDWPGNVRELENTIERAVVLSTGTVISARAVSVLGAAAPQATTLPSLKLRQNIEWVERETIRRALESAAGVKKDAAELMGISQRALVLLPGEVPSRLSVGAVDSGLRGRKPVTPSVNLPPAGRAFRTEGPGNVRHPACVGSCDVRTPLVIGIVLVCTACGCGGDGYRNDGGMMGTPTPVSSPDAMVVTIRGTAGHAVVRSQSSAHRSGRARRLAQP